MFTEYLLLLVLATAAKVALSSDDRSLNRFRGHVVKNGDKFEVVTSLESSYKKLDDNVGNAVATGFWDQTYNITGWSILEIRTFENQSNADQAYAAGLLEGQLTRDLTSKQWKNSIADICAGDGQKSCVYLKEFYGIQLDWLYDQITQYPDDEYWHHVHLILIQLNGLIDGYQNTPLGPRMHIDDPLGFFLFQVVESVGDLLKLFGVPNAPRHDSCSALIKILPNNSDIFVSHADWSNYKTMLKVIKKYTMPLRRISHPDAVRIDGIDIVFSSYPGTLHSIDDFYMTRPGGLTVIETTIENYNNDLWYNLMPLTVPEWIRVTIANRLTRSGPDWVNKFFVNNDGTYNNQWMIVDFNQFKPNQPPRDGFLTVAEQMLTDFESMDMTQTLINKTYWASYNNIYFDRFRQISHENDMVTKFGPELYSWKNSSRARIFDRDHVKVVDLESMIHMMRYNDFKNDSFSLCPGCNPPYSAELTIASRCDLNPINGTYPQDALGHRVHGATDAKITNFAFMQNFTLVALAGPTSDQQPPFIWSQSDFDTKVSHEGQPDKWDFPRLTPAWFLP